MHFLQDDYSSQYMTFVIPCELSSLPFDKRPECAQATKATSILRRRQTLDDVPLAQDRLVIVVLLPLNDICSISSARRVVFTAADALDADWKLESSSRLQPSRRVLIVVFRPLAITGSSS